MIENAGASAGTGIKCVAIPTAPTKASMTAERILYLDAKSREEETVEKQHYPEGA